MDKMKGVIFVFGPPGVGKLSIAREICLRKPDIRLVHNHLINNLIFEIARPVWGEPVRDDVWESVRAVRAVVLEAIRKFEFVEVCLFTNVLMTLSDVSEKMYSELKELARFKQVNFFPIRLSISENEWRRRIVSNDRSASMKQRFVTDEDLRMFRGGVYIPIEDDFLDLDVTHLSAQKSADKVLQWIDAKEQGVRSSLRFPPHRAD